MERAHQLGLRRCFQGLGLSLLLMSLIGRDAWATGPTVEFKLPAGEFADMVVEFAHQADVEISYSSPVSVKGIKTRAVYGRLPASEALTLMLEGTGFLSQWDDDRSATLYRDARKKLPKPEETNGPPKKAVSQDKPLPLASADTLAEVRVTGTHLRTVEEITAPVVSIRQRELNRTGYASADAAVASRAFNFAGGAREDLGNTTLGNFARGIAANLRGLGPGATLVLVNGRRQPASGTDGNFVDMSAVPVSAIERIDVMTDGASALYGSDAIAGVVNIILREDLDGAETRTRLATVQGSGDEVLFAQLTASHWEGGRALFNYQFSTRGALAAAERDYIWNADKREFGGDDFRSVQSSPGNILDPRTLQPAFAIPANQNGQRLRASELIAGERNLQNQFAGRDLLPRRETHSVYLTASQHLSDRYSTFAEARYNRRELRNSQPARALTFAVPASNPYYVDPFGDSPYVLLAYNFFDVLGSLYETGYVETTVGTVGIRADLPGNWRATLAGTYGRERFRSETLNEVDSNALNAALASADPATAFNPFGTRSQNNPATLESIRVKNNVRHSANTVAHADLSMDGPLLALPTGPVQLALGLEARREELALDHQGQVPRDFSRENVSVYSELSIPLAARLRLSAAGRYERFNDFGSALTHNLGLTWSPSSALRIRSSWGTSFRAPRLSDLDERETNTAAGLLSLPDPHSTTGQALVLAIQGQNAHLHQETATSWTAGFDIAAPSSSPLTASFTYFDIDYRDQVILPIAVSPFTILFEEERWGAPVIIRNPSRAQADELCATPLFIGSREECFATLPDAILDIRLRNLASNNVAGIDFALAQKLALPRGELNWSLDGTYLRKFDRALTRSSGTVDLLDTFNNPISRRLRGTLGWYQHGEAGPGFSGSLTAHYAGAYRDDRSVPARRIRESAMFDLQIEYRTPRGGRAFDDFEVSLGAINVFDEDPPFVNTEFGYDAANGSAMGRLITLLLQKNW